MGIARSRSGPRARSGQAAERFRALPLAVRTFLFALIPLCVVVLAGIVSIRAVIEHRVKSALHESLRRREADLNRTRARDAQRREKVLARLAAQEAIRCALGEVREIEDRRKIRLALEEQLPQLAGLAETDLLLVSDWLGRGVAGLEPSEGNRALAEPERLSVAEAAMVESGGRVYEINTLPVVEGGEKIGHVSLGTVYDISLAGGSGHAALTRFGRVVQTSFPAWTVAALEGQLFLNCSGSASECDLRHAGDPYVVRAIRHGGAGGEYRLLLFQSARGAAGEFVKAFWPILAALAGCALLVAAVVALIGSRTVARPLARLSGRLRECERTGRLPRDFPAGSATREINELADALNRAAESVLDSQLTVNRSFLHFLENMTQAIDARDPHTAGHSRRVGEYASAIAQAMRLPAAEIESVRVGALLHDIGKIGVPEAILQKSERLTPAEEELVRQHPAIGRRIVERVGGFDDYVAAIELHHEDWDGGGYPRGLRAREIPLAARIVRVADAWDNLTTDRAHRRAMPADRAAQILIGCAAKQFDPEIVDVFLAIQPPPKEAEEPLPVPVAT